ncbi:MAG: hypothetical protein M5U28_36440 [Sandaracinaceae bacterium]|nr:hypothetical protein [Sandaracinaceae bacterium]
MLEGLLHHLRHAELRLAQLVAEERAGERPAGAEELRRSHEPRCTTPRSPLAIGAAV